MKGTLGSLLRTTLEQVGLVKDAVERQAKSQRVWLDSALLHRKHREALTGLGEIVYTLAASGELGDLEEYPEIARQLALLVDLEQRIADAAVRAREATENARQAAERFVQRATWPAAEVRRRVWHRPDQPHDWRSAAGFPDWSEVDEEDPFDVDPEPPPPPPPRSPRSPRRRPSGGGGGIAFTDNGQRTTARNPEPFVEADFGNDFATTETGEVHAAFDETDFDEVSGFEPADRAPGEFGDDELDVVALGNHLHSSDDLAAIPDAELPPHRTYDAPRKPKAATGAKPSKPRSPGEPVSDPEN